MDNPFGKKEETANPLVKAVEESKKAEEKKEEVIKPEDKVLRTKAEILKKHGGLESNIPVNSSYWKLRK